jgi:hypothetical protein
MFNKPHNHSMKFANCESCQDLEKDKRTMGESDLFEDEQYSGGFETDS